MRISDWVKKNILDYLNLTEYMKSTKKDIERLGRIDEMLLNDFRQSANEIRDIKSTLENVVEIGADVSAPPNDSHNWAVICVKGKMDYVKFVDLNHKDIKDIQMYLSRFDAGSQCIDSPVKTLGTKPFKFFW